MLAKSSIGNLPILSYEAQTAGTTQTQAGATALTKAVAKVTTGNANDGVALPRADQPCHLNQVVIIKNLSAVALKVYPYYTSAATNQDDGTAFGGTIDGGAANAAVAHTASLTFLYICTAKNTWISVLLS